MRNHRWFLIILTIFLLGFFSHALYLKKTVYGDGIYYYSWLRSVVVDHDFKFNNEYQHFGVTEQRTPIGSTGNKFSVGPAILWSPGYIWLHSLIKGEGYELPYQLIVGLTSVFYGIFGLILLYRLLTKYFPDEICRLTVLCIALATNFFYYSALDTVNSHAVSFFAVTLFLSFLLREKKNWFLVGLSLGLVGLIRVQDLIFGLLIIPFVIARTPIRSEDAAIFKNIFRDCFSRKNVIAMTKIIIGFLSTFLPQLLAWQALYSRFWMNPYLLRGDYFDLFHPRLLEALFAPWTGFILWSPIVLLGIFGLFIMKNKLRLYIFLTILIEIIILATYSEGQGATVGSRYMISSLPLIGFGLGYFFDKLLKHLDLKIVILILVAPLSALNFLLTFVYLLLY